MPVDNSERFELFTLVVALCGPTDLNEKLNDQTVSDQAIVDEIAQFSPAFARLGQTARQELTDFVQAVRAKCGEVGGLFTAVRLWGSQPPHPSGADVSRMIGAARLLNTMFPTP